MQPIHVNDLKPKIGNVLQTVTDFVVVISIDDGPVPLLHTRSIRTGLQGSTGLGAVTGIMVPIDHGVKQQVPAGPLNDVQPKPVVPTPVPLLPKQSNPEEPPKKSYEIVKGPAPKPRHVHEPPKPESPKTEVPAIVQEPATAEDS